MGKAWKATGIFGGLALATFIPYTQSSPDDWFCRPLFIFSIVAAIFFFVLGVIYLILLIRKHLNPLDIKGQFYCYYLTLEKELRLNWWFCDYSDSIGYRLSCVAKVSGQVINLNDKININTPSFSSGSASCGKGQKWVVECFKYNADLIDVDKAIITIKIRPEGIWVNKQKTEEVAIQLIKHG